MSQFGLLDSHERLEPVRSGKQREALIYETILRAYVTGQLPPGTRLPEQQLAEIFDVSRERVRKVLQRLADARWIDIAPNRGAAVPQAGMEDAREILQARIVMETGILEQLRKEPRLIDEAALRAHVASERKAELASDAVEVMRLTARFHSVIAGFLRNAWIARNLEDLVLRSLVFVSLYGDAVASGFCGSVEHYGKARYAAGPGFCGVAEHSEIARQLVEGDFERARAEMVAHLEGMQLFLDFRTERRLERSLAEIFSASVG